MIKDHLLWSVLSRANLYTQVRWMDGYISQTQLSREFFIELVYFLFCHHTENKMSVLLSAKVIAQHTWWIKPAAKLLNTTGCHLHWLQNLGLIVPANNFLIKPCKVRHPWKFAINNFAEDVYNTSYSY